MELARFFGFLHPALVHFPLVLLLVSVALEVVGFFQRDRRFTWAAQITLLLGTTATLFAFVAGNFAEIWAARDGIPQDPMEFHELLATITSWTFVFLTAGRLFLGVGANRRAMAAYLFAATVACGLLIYTGHKGAMLVYNHGAGVHAAGLPPLATHEDMAVLLQKQDPDALFYSNKMHHVFGWMVLLLSGMLLTDMVSPRWGDRLRRFAPLLLLAGGVFLMIFSDQDAWPLYQTRPFRPWTDKEVLMHKTYAILMLVFGMRGLWNSWREGKSRAEKTDIVGAQFIAPHANVAPHPGLLAASNANATPNTTLEHPTPEYLNTQHPTPTTHHPIPNTRQLHARMMAIFALIGGALLFTHVHSNAPYANVAAGVYIHHTVMGFIALCIGAVKLIEDALIQQRKNSGVGCWVLGVGEMPLRPIPRDANRIGKEVWKSADDNDYYLNTERLNTQHPTPNTQHPTASLSLTRFLAWAYPCLMLIESIFLINYNEGLPWFIGYRNLSLSAPHHGLIAPLGNDRAEFVYDPATQKMDVYVLNQGDNGLHAIQVRSAQALLKVGTDTTAVDLTPDVSEESSSHFTGTASFLRGIPLFQAQALVRPIHQSAEAAPLVADFEPYIDQAFTAPHSTLPYVCPMHAAQGASQPGTCALCGMALTPNKPPRKGNKLADDAYRMDAVWSARADVKDVMGSAATIAFKPVKNPQIGDVTYRGATVSKKEFAAESDGRDTEHHDTVGPLMQRISQLAAGQTVHLELKPRYADGKPVTDLDVVHTKKLHLIIVGRDLAFFDHVHPEPQSDGSLTLDYTFAHGGEYVLYADCAPHGDRNQVFRIPVTVTGRVPAPQPLIVTPAQARVFGAYRVALTLTPDPPQPNDETQLTFTVSKDGLPVTDLEPFLGAGGHCVVLSEDTLGYLHSHPATMGGDRFGPTLAFHARFPRAGVYKIWAQFQHQGHPLTADFVVRIP